MKPQTTHETKRKSLQALFGGKSAAALSPETQSISHVSSSDDLPTLIAQRAYALYCERGCRDGYALEDWLEAEREILKST